MVPLLLFHLVVLFVSRTNSGVVPQNFKSTDNESSHLEAIFTNTSANASNLTLAHSELHNESSSGLVDLENVNASSIPNTDLHNISDLEHVVNDISEESHAVKKISGRSKKKVPKESNKKRESFNKTFREESDHTDTDNVKPTTSIRDHSGDNNHFDNNVSEKLDHIEHITNNHFDDKSHHSENLTIGSDLPNNASKSFHHGVDKEFNTSLDGGNHLEDVTSDLNHFNPDHLNDSVVDPLSNTSNSLVHDGNKELNTSVLDDRNHLKDAHFNSDHLNDSVVDPLSNASNSLDHDVNKVFNTSVLDDRNHLEDVTSDLNHFNPDHLNESVVDLKKPLNKVTETVSKELNSTLETTSELNNHSQTISDVPNTFGSQTDHFGPTENFQNTSIQLNKAAVILSNSSKLFLNIHNSFMKLNRTDKPESLLSNHIDKTSSENATSLHDIAKKDEKSFEKSSDTDNSFQGFNSSDLQTDKPSNITKELDTINIPISDTKDNKFGHETKADIIGTAAPNVGDVNFPSDLPGELKVNIKKSESTNSDIKEPTVTETNETQGLFSTLGLDFLMNSELAKNAASAMEVFNFSDSALTDHIVDDKNDMHDFLEFIPLVHNQSNSDHTPATSSTTDAESPTIDAESPTIDAESPTIDTESPTIDAGSSTLITESSTLLDNDEKTFLNPAIENESDPTSHSLDVLSSENSSSEILTTTLSSPILNSTVEFEVTAIPSQIFSSTVEFEATTIPSQLMFNSTVEYEVTTKIPLPVLRNGTEIISEAKCPPPGFCIFWFLGQDTCTLNSHCLGSRICCRIGCTKTCVEV